MPSLYVSLLGSLAQANFVWNGDIVLMLAVSDSETKHPTAILRLNPTKET